MPIKPTKAGGYDVSVCVSYRRIHRRLPPGTSASAAKRIEAELIRALHQHQRQVHIPGDPPLTELMAYYTEVHCLKLRHPESGRFHAYRIGRWLTGKRASETRQTAAAIVADLSAAYRPATINRSLGTLKKALRLAWDRGVTPVDYSSLVKRLPENNARSVYLSIDQVQRLADCASARVKAAIWISLYTGLRRGELLKLKPEDIGKDTLKVQAGNTKTLRYREVPIVPPARSWLRQIPLEITAEGLKTGFQRARVKAGIDVNFHDLRRSCGTILLQSGAPMHVVSKMLGHSSSRVTEERYAFLDHGEVRRAMQKAFTPPVTPARQKRRVTA